MQIDPGGVYRLKKTVLVAVWDGAGVLFDVRSRCCVELNRTGVEVIELLQTNDPLSRIIQRLAEAYGQPAARLQKDLVGFIERLHEKGMIDGGNQTDIENQG
jgi:hypothetical protein